MNLVKRSRGRVPTGAVLFVAMWLGVPTAGRARAREPRRKGLTVRFFAAGHGDATLFRTASGHNILIDAGMSRARGENTLRRRILPYLRRMRIKRLDAFIITHPHNDHYGDPALLRRHVSFPRILTNRDGVVALRWMLPLLYDAADRWVPFVGLRRGDRLRFGRLRIDVLNPPVKDRSRSRAPYWSIMRVNNRSLVLRVSYGKIRFLMTGDLGAKGERRMLKAGLPGRADVLKLGHHGQGSTTEGWLKAIQPRFAVFTCCSLPWFKRMSVRLKRRLRRHGVTLFRTDKHRDIEFTTEGTDLRARVAEDLSGLTRRHRLWVYADRKYRRRKAIRKIRRLRKKQRDRARKARLTWLRRQRRGRNRVPALGPGPAASGRRLLEAR